MTQNSLFPFDLWRRPSMRKEDLISPVKWNVYVIAIDIIVLFLFSIISSQGTVGIDSLRFFPTLLLIESAIILFVGSSFEMSSSIFFSKVRKYVFHSKEEWSMEEYEKGRRRASPYIIFGFLLLSESFLFSFMIS